MATAYLTSAPASPDHPARRPVRPLIAGQAVLRIMKQTEITPGLWGQPVEVGETRSSTVAHQFCMDQNKVTMQLNRPKMTHFFAEPTYAEPMSAADVAAHRSASHVRRPAVIAEQDSPTPPSEPAARRRFIQQREW